MRILITNKIAKAIEIVLNELEMPLEDVNVTISNRKDLCDYQFDGAFKLAKLYHKNPMEIGSQIVERLQTGQDFQKVEVLPPEVGS